MSKSKILQRIRSAPSSEHTSLPDIPFFDDHPIDLLQQFQDQLIANKAQVLMPTADQSWQAMVRELTEGSSLHYAQFDDIPTSPMVLKVSHPRELEDLDIVILEGKIGVADNGAIWVSGFTPRVIPFITKQLVIVIDQKRIVRHMHHAYDQIDPQELDFGVFISGPSKTADIEQALVVGAQGALELCVIIK